MCETNYLLPAANKVCECFVFTGVCPQRGGHAWQGACVLGRHPWQGVCVPCTHTPRYYDIPSMSRRYASYFNSFLLFNKNALQQHVYSALITVWGVSVTDSPLDTDTLGQRPHQTDPSGQRPSRPDILQTDFPGPRHPCGQTDTCENKLCKVRLQAVKMHNGPCSYYKMGFLCRVYVHSDKALFNTMSHRSNKMQYNSMCLCQGGYLLKWGVCLEGFMATQFFTWRNAKLFFSGFHNYLYCKISNIYNCTWFPVHKTWHIQSNSV